jgi:UDP-N-acetylmuramoyl-tripeptide--D-alanyl-D-alanine ligase
MTPQDLMAGLAQLDGARVVGPLPAGTPRLHTDTRTLQAGDLFWALRGERFDANDLLPQAAAAGACAAVAHHGLAAAGLVGVEVPDTRLALGTLATRWRAQFDLPLVAVTGSNGKTTVTQMVASVFRAAVGGNGEAALATQGNLNNDLGVPQTLLRLRATHRLAVVELGMNHPGEIAQLAAMAQPTVALVNNAQREHQEFMGTVEAVARENGASLQALPANGTAVFPADDAFTPLWHTLAGGRRVVTFSDTDATATVHGLAQPQGLGWSVRLQTPQGSAECHLALAGRHNLRNALAAAACALAAGVALPAIAQGLSAFRPVNGRSQTLSLPWPGGALTVVNDTYNANPDSVRAAIDVLASLPGPRVLVLGDMGEVGDQALDFHTEVLTHAERSGLPVWTTGAHMGDAVAHLPPHPQRQWVGDMADLLPRVLAQLAPGGSVLVKGSRFMRMERVVQAIQAQSEALAASSTSVSQEGAHAR